jgi:diguanylate cyclase (GGDEF)-like protein
MNTWSAIFATSVLISCASFALYMRERRRTVKLTLELNGLSNQGATTVSGEAKQGLLTRADFDAAVAKRTHTVDRVTKPFGVLSIAVDNFVLLNEAFGNDTGDRLLKEVSRRLVMCNGAKTQACHIAVGEFALIIDGGQQTAHTYAKRVSDALAVPFTFEAIRAQLTCSIGIAVYPDHGAVSKLLGNAAMAMRSVKLNGGSDFCLYDPKMGVEAREQALLYNDLRNALDKGEFELYFQPKIDAISLQVTGAEALLRWHHPERGLVSPVVFIPLAEQYGLIGPIGHWVIAEACRKAASWREKGLHMRVAVNISGYQMREDDLVNRIEAALQRYGIQPERFTCEITESVAMEDTKVTQLTFEKMRNAGFHVSIDDFGTGYSSLAALRKLPAREVKIDRAFVSDLEESEDARSIAQSIVNLATALNLRVVAEGVETAGQRDLLVAMGCNELQGFLFSMPIPAYELERLALHEYQPDEMGFSKSLFSETYLGKLH